MSQIQKIRIGDQLYPAYQTMGAMLAFKQETGKEVTEIPATDISGMMVYLFCVVRSACKREKVEFPFTDTQALGDGITLEDFKGWADSLKGEDNEEPAEEPANEAPDIPQEDGKGNGKKGK